VNQLKIEDSWEYTFSSDTQSAVIDVYHKHIHHRVLHWVSIMHILIIRNMNVQNRHCSQTAVASKWYAFHL